MGVAFLTFGIAKLTPGDPARFMAGKTATPETIARLHEQLHLDDPFLVQYGRFLWRAMHGDLGVSYRGQKPVFRSILSRFPSTLQLAGAATLVA
ncbi:MAG: ABC transporter permease, partial [Anaerolineaceae bacterium]